MSIKCILFRLQQCPEHTGQFSKCRGRWRGQVPFSAPDFHQEHTNPEPGVPSWSPPPAAGDECRDADAVAEMTGTQPLITFVAKHTKFLLSHRAEVSLSSHPALSAVSSTQQLKGPNLALAPSYLPAPPLTSQEGIKSRNFSCYSYWISL